MNQTENLYTTDCIRTFTGKYVNVFEPKPEMFCIEDIAHALSFQCRFGGHLPHFYTVAQHSVHVSRKCDCGNSFTGLMHDVSEAYLVDIPRPIKLRLPEYQAIEDQLNKVLAQVFGFQYPFPPDIKEADKYCLEDEWEWIFMKRSSARVLSISASKQLFLERYYELKKLSA
jgi:5'-deoxynucleotidase YfbR-like HD superfamily hydrolase